MQRRSSPSMRPRDNGASRWQQRSSSAAMPPSPLRYRTMGSSSIVRQTTAASAKSSAQPATYQQLRKNIADPPPPTGTIGPRASRPRQRKMPAGRRRSQVPSAWPGDRRRGLQRGADLLFGRPPIRTLDLGDAVADDVGRRLHLVEAAGVAAEEL